MTTASTFGTFFLPGPTEVRREILEAQCAPMIPHRGAAFEALYARLQAPLRAIFRTDRPVYVSSSSATGLMEAAVRCAPAGRVLSLVNGAFAERFAEIARACGRDVDVISVPWGDVVSLDAVTDAFRAQRYAALTVVHSETSTGALTSLAELATLCQAHGVMSLVDSVTGLAGAPVETDAWALDVVFTGSQKALALPPGLAFGVVSERYLATVPDAPARGRYFDIAEFEQYAHRNQTPNTPAVSLMYAAAAQGEAILRDGIESRWARHADMAARTHRWVHETRESLGIPLCIQAREDDRSPTVTCIALPPGIAGEAVVKATAARGFVIGGGYGKLKPSAFRIGHMGDHTVAGLERCLAACADALRALVP